jgi:phosphotriesterase-related protein
VLRRLSEGSGVHIVTNTGLYGAADDRFVPAYAYEAPVEVLARDWIREWQNGIDGTEVRPGFMKIGVDAGPLSPIDAKLVEAAAIAHRETGLRIHAHTGDAEAGLAELDLLARLGVPPGSFVWVHAQNGDDPDVLASVAARGAWIELDDVAPANVAERAAQVARLAERGHLGRVLVSHDAGAYTVGEEGGAPGSFRPYDTVITDLAPRLRSLGFGDDELDTLLIGNPRAVLSPSAWGIASQP